MTEIEEVRMSGAPVATVARPKGAVASLLLATLGFFLITLDVSIVNLALPSMAADLGGDTSAQQWILDGYTLFFAALLLFAGNLSDRLGAKRAYVIGIAAFAVTSLLGALAPTMSFLIGARCVQGIAAALMLPASMTLVREAFPDSAPRARALGVWAAGGAVASAAGPILGGVLSSWDWRLVFLVNVPVCAVMLLLFIRVARSPGRPSRFDWAGQLLALIALGTLIYALIEGGVVGYTAPVIIGLFLLGAVALAAFIGVQARSRTPMMPLTLFGSGAMRVAFFGGFVFIFAWFGTVFLASLYLQQHLGMPAALAGLVFLPGAIGSFVGNLSSGPLTNRFGPRVPAALGMTLLLLGLVGFAVSAPADSAILIGAFLAVSGIGGSIATPSLAGVVLASAPAGQAGIASAVANTYRQVGGAFAIAVFGVLVSGGLGFITGLQVSAGIAAVLALVAALLALTLPGPAPARRTEGSTSR